MARGAARIIDNLFSRLPFIKMIYSSIKDLVNAFVGDQKRFDKPVLVSLFSESTVQTLGFITRESLENIGIAERLAVYLPQSYNFAGNVVVVSRDQVIPLNIESGKVMTFIVSGGVSGF